MISFFDFLNGSHELKRLTNPSNVDKENCEWNIEPVESETQEGPALYTIKNQAHGEPIFADSVTFFSTFVRRSVFLKHKKTIFSDNYKWLIDC